MKLKDWLILVGITGAVIAGYGAHVRSQGRLEGELSAARAEFSALRLRMRAVDTVYVRDTVRFTRLRTRLDTLLVDKHITDTVWVRNLVHLADSTALACTDVLNSCGARIAVRDSMLFNLRTQNAKLLKLSSKSKLFGFLPRPTLQVGACVDQRLHPSLCLSAGFPITR